MLSLWRKTVKIKNTMENLKSNRRDFFKTSALGVLGTVSMPAILGSCSGNASNEAKVKDVIIPDFFEEAPDGKPLKAGLVGCGGRGTGAAQNFLDAGNGLQITALGDVFPDKLEACRKTLKDQGHEVADQNCFTGFDAYKKVIDSDIDIVLLATPPLFRPEHFDYAVSKGKHCFIEKPAAVDPTGIRQVLVTSKKASQAGLTVVTGTCLRSSKTIIETYKRVAQGDIGEIVSAHVTRLGGALWFKKREPGWSDMEYLLRNWVSFCRASGDCVVEMLVHEIDLMTWFLGDKLPIRAESTGGRQRRVTGDMYDHFSMTYIYENGMRAHCTQRQIDGCNDAMGVFIYGTKGYADPRSSKIFNKDGSIMWEAPSRKRGDPPQPKAYNIMVQEHIRLVNAIRTGNPINEADKLAYSTLIAIMGRESAYTGKFITWDEAMASTLKLSLDNYEMGPIPGFNEDIPLAGTAPVV